MTRAALSPQMHHHRAEHWVAVSGTGRVNRGDEVFAVSENGSIFIPLGARHRLENPGKVPQSTALGGEKSARLGEL